jgi:hypothetical protein
MFLSTSPKKAPLPGNQQQLISTKACLSPLQVLSEEVCVTSCLISSQALEECLVLWTNLLKKSSSQLCEGITLISARAAVQREQEERHRALPAGAPPGTGVS